MPSSRRPWKAKSGFARETSAIPSGRASSEASARASWRPSGTRRIASRRAKTHSRTRAEASPKRS
eukprot:4145926-Pyramimonas_sp.AAC.1